MIEIQTRTRQGDRMKCTEEDLEILAEVVGAALLAISIFAIIVLSHTMWWG